MKATKTERTTAMNELKDMSRVLKGLVDEVRMQVHLGAMELKSDAGPYLAEVSSASKAATRDLVKRGRALSAHLRRIRAEHRRAV